MREFRFPALDEFLSICASRGWISGAIAPAAIVEKLPPIPVASRVAAGRLPAMEFPRLPAVEVNVPDAIVVGRNFSLAVDDLLFPLGYAHSPLGHPPSITAGSPAVRSLGERRVQVDPPPRGVVDAPCASLLGIVSHFGHFVVDALERLIAQPSPASEQRPLLVDADFFGEGSGPAILPAQVAALAALAGRDLSRARLFPIQRDRDYRLPSLHFRTPEATKPLVSPAVMEALAALANRFPHGRDERLFVGRLDVPTRRLVNREALLARLDARGYREVLPERLSIPEAVTTFAGASRVLIAIGSAKFNLAFCAPGTRVVGIVPQGYASGGVAIMLRHLCSLRGLRLGLYECPGHATSPGESPIGADLLVEDEDLTRMEWLLEKL